MPYAPKVTRFVVPPYVGSGFWIDYKNPAYMSSTDLDTLNAMREDDDLLESNRELAALMIEGWNFTDVNAEPIASETVDEHGNVVEPLIEAILPIPSVDPTVWGKIPPMIGMIMATEIGRVLTENRADPNVTSSSTSSRTPLKGSLSQKGSTTSRLGSSKR